MELNETKIEKYLKYYNIWSYLIFRYIMKTDVILLSIYRQSYTNDEAASWYDVIDGIGWICFFIGSLITIGYVFNMIGG